jgi:hypothetical protein
MEKLVRPHVLDSVLDDGYRVMTMDAEREREAAEWCDALSRDVIDEVR